MADAWKFTYEGYWPDEERHREALCTVGNGYMATRGAAPESSADKNHYPGTYIAGCYNRLKTEISNETVENESLVNLPNWLFLTFRIEDDNWFKLEDVDIKEYRQELDIRKAGLERSVLFSDKKGRLTRLTQHRFISMSSSHVCALKTVIVAENWSGNIRIRSALEGRLHNSGVDRYKNLNSTHLQPVRTDSVHGDIILLEVQTNQSQIYISEAARTRIFHNDESLMVHRDAIQEPGYIAQECNIHLVKGDELRVEKIVGVYTSKDRAISECSQQAIATVDAAGDYEKSLQEHSLAWEHLWRRCFITIKLRGGDENTGRILHLHILHLLQTVSTNTIDLDVGVPPRGLHGEAYRGHVMWDELFIFPFLNLRIPDITRALLQYRYRRLPEARRRAAREGFKGALYPWQSGSDGSEESQTLHLNPMSGRWIPDHSNLQRHINIAVAYNVWQYYQVTGDHDYLHFYGAEMIMEIARFWASVAHYNGSRKRYEINGVMGPDEFHERYPDAEVYGLKNNSYTNLMVVWLMCRALETLEVLPEHRRVSICERLQITQDELDHWNDISRKMFVPFHESDIISQFEGYEELREFDWEAYRQKYGNIQRLDRILESENDSANRYKVSKQADVLMLFYLLSSEEIEELFGRLGYNFDPELIPRNIDYYIKRTSDGSTLSALVHSWVMARSERDRSWDLFRESLASDVEDVQGGTTSEGIHLGAVAGTVDLVQRCYSGIEVRHDVLKFNPALPDELSYLNFSITYREHRLNIQIDDAALIIQASESHAKPIQIAFREETRQLASGETVRFKMK